MSLMNQWFEEVWNKGRESAIDENVFHDVPGHGLQGPMAERFAAWMPSRPSTASSGQRCLISCGRRRRVTEGDLTVARCTVTRSILARAWASRQRQSR